MEIKDLTDKRIWSGNNLDDLKTLLEEIDQHTELYRVSSVDVELLSLKKGFVTTSGKPIFKRYNPIHGEQLEIALPLETEENKERLLPLVKELKQNRLMLRCGDNKYFTAESLIPTMTMRIGSGGANAKRPSFKRDAYFAELLGVAEQDVQLLIRRVDDVKKIFAMYSNRYTLVPQTVILDIINQIEHGLGKPVCKRWIVSNARTEVQLDFPERARDFARMYNLPDKIIPGLRLITSDVGESSVCAIGTWKLRERTIGSDVYMRKHTGRIVPEKILEQIDRCIFAKYEKIPKTLCELMKIDIREPMAAVESVFQQINLKDAIGMRREQQLCKIMEPQFNPRLKYTAYDIATTVMALSASIQGMSPTVEKRFANCVIGAVFADYREYENTLVAIPA